MYRCSPPERPCASGSLWDPVNCLCVSTDMINYSQRETGKCATVTLLGSVKFLCGLKNVDKKYWRHIWPRKSKYITGTLIMLKKLWTHALDQCSSALVLGSHSPAYFRCLPSPAHRIQMTVGSPQQLVLRICRGLLVTPKIWDSVSKQGNI